MDLLVRMDTAKFNVLPLVKHSVARMDRSINLSFSRYIIMRFCIFLVLIFLGLSQASRGAAPPSSQSLQNNQNASENSLAAASPFDEKTLNYCYGNSHEKLLNDEMRNFSELSKYQISQNKSPLFSDLTKEQREFLKKLHKDRRYLCEKIEKFERGLDIEMKNIQEKFNIAQGKGCDLYIPLLDSIRNIHTKIVSFIPEIKKYAHENRDRDEDLHFIQVKKIRELVKKNQVARAESGSLFREVNSIWGSGIPGVVFKVLEEGPYSEFYRLNHRASEAIEYWNTVNSGHEDCVKRLGKIEAAVKASTASSIKKKR